MKTLQGRRDVDLTGQKFGRLTVIKLDSVRGSHKYWECLCDCGKTKAVRASLLLNGNTRSCRCLQIEKLVQRSTTHGLYGSPTYLSWRAMIQRCENPSTNDYDLYGGRGITVAPAWHSFEVFLADMGERPGGKTLDRIDPDGNYEPGNCRWATLSEQQRNKRDRVVHHRHIKSTWRNGLNPEQKTSKTLCGKSTPWKLAGIPSITPQIIQVPVRSTIEPGWCPVCCHTLLKQLDEIAVKTELDHSAAAICVDTLDHLI